MEQKSLQLNEFKKTDIAKEISEAFPDAGLIDIIEDDND